MVPKLGKEDRAVNGEEALVGGLESCEEGWGPTRSLSWAAAASAVNPRLNSIPENLTTAGRGYHRRIDRPVGGWLSYFVDGPHWSQVTVTTGGIEIEMRKGMTRV